MTDKYTVELTKIENPLKRFIKAGYNAVSLSSKAVRIPRSHTLYYVLSGEFCFSFSGEKHIVGKNSIIHLSNTENAEIRNVSKSENSSLYYLMFDLNEGVSLSSLGIPRVTTDEEGRHLELVKSIYKTHLSEAAAYKLKTYGEFTLLLYELISAGISVNENFRVNLKLSKALQYIRMNYYKNISVETLSSIAGYSVSHFRKLFVSEYGVSPQEYMINYRIRKAKEMLLEDDGKTMEEIASLVGMCNASYFCRKFKEKTGVSPRKYK